MKKRSILLLLSGLMFSAVLLAAWLYLPGGIDESRAALAEYDLQKMTCGSCVAKIEAALQDMPGIGAVEIDLTSNRGRIIFDPATTNAEAIARTISTAGYPAALRTQLNAQELVELRSEESRLVRKFVAKVGERYVTRSEFEALLGEVAGHGGEGDAPTTAAVRLKVWNDLLQREMLLNAAARSGVVVQDGEVEARLQEIEQQHPGFEARLVAEFGSREQFRLQLRDDLVIQRTLDDHVLAGTSDPAQRKALLQNWYAELVDRTEVKIYDPQLKALASSKLGGCGGSCCG